MEDNLNDVIRELKEYSDYYGRKECIHLLESIIDNLKTRKKLDFGLEPEAAFDPFRTISPPTYEEGSDGKVSRGVLKKSPTGTVNSLIEQNSTTEETYGDSIKSFNNSQAKALGIASQSAQDPTTNSLLETGRQGIKSFMETRTGEKLPDDFGKELMEAGFLALDLNKVLAEKRKLKKERKIEEELKIQSVQSQLEEAQASGEEISPELREEVEDIMDVAQQEVDDARLE